MFTRLSLTWECLLTPFKTLSVLQVHFFEKRSKTDPKTSEPLPTSDVPKVPDFQPQILGVPKAAEWLVYDILNASLGHLVDYGANVDNIRKDYVPKPRNLALVDRGNPTWDNIVRSVPCVSA